MKGRKLKIVYCTPSLYIAGGVERVLTQKANYLADVLGYDITIVLTDGKDKPLFYPLSEKIRVVNLGIDFDELWAHSFLGQIVPYLRKQRVFKSRLKELLLEIRPDITVSLLRREINFLTSIGDGSRKVGELHVNRKKYRYYEANNTNIVKEVFAWFWMKNLIGHLRRLDRFVVLTEEDRRAWPEVEGVVAIADPLPFFPDRRSPLTAKRVIAVGRYEYQKGFDLLLRAWAMIERQCPDWRLDVFGHGEREAYEELIGQLGVDRSRCRLNGPTDHIQEEYLNSSVFAFSSRYEGFGMVLIEAMACGIPAVSFDCPCGPKDIIRDGEDGFLVTTGDVEAFSKALLTVIQDSALRERMGANARRNVKRFEMKEIAGQWERLFGELIIEN